MTQIDTTTSIIIGDDRKTTYDCKGKTDLYMPCTANEFTTNTHDGKPAFQGAKAKGNTLYVTIYMNLSTENNQENWGNLTLTFKNYDSIKNVYCLLNNDNGQKGGSNVKEDYKTDVADNFYQFVVESLWTTKKDKYSLTGSNFSEKIDLSDATNYAVGEDNKGYTVNASGGNDEITGTAGNDTLSGGAGDNTIHYSCGADVVKLTKGENLTLDLAGKVVSYSLGGKKKSDLIINIGGSDSITLSNFAKSNVVGAKGKVELSLDPVGDPIDLNSATILDDYSDENIKGNKKKRTASFTGTRLGDKISIDADSIDMEAIGITFTETEEDLEKTFEGNVLKYTINAGGGDNDISFSGGINSNTIIAGSGNDKISIEDTYFYDPDDDDFKGFKKALTTVKAGAGDNEITVNGAGRNLLISGKGNDIINISGPSTNTIKAGAGKNTINIDSFGDVTIAEEKVKAENNIVFDNLANLKFQKIGKSNDLIVTTTVDDDAKITVKEFFTDGKKHATNLVNDLDFETLLQQEDIDYTVTGEGVINGSKYSEKVVGSSKSDKIYAGKGNDTINAGEGDNQIYVFTGDGADTIEKSSGSDTVIFKKGTKINIGYAETGKTDNNGNDICDLRIYYSKDNKDYVNIENAVTFDGLTYHFDKTATSVTALKVGNKTFTLDSLLNRNSIENVLTDGKVVGTEKHDDIYVTDTNEFKNSAEVTINGDAGSDYIMIGSNQTGNASNVDPANYNFIDIKPTVYTHTVDGKQDTLVGTYDRVTAYASQGGTYNAQSSMSHIQVFGEHNDTYNVYYKDQFTKIYDEAGTEDVLYIKDKNHGDLKLIFTISDEYKDYTTALADIDTGDLTYNQDMIGAIANSLQEIKIVTSEDRNFFLEDPNGNGVGIDIDYWGDKGLNANDSPTDAKAAAMLAISKDTLAKFGSGVEKIVAADGWYITKTDIVTVAAAVAEWLDGKIGGVDHEFGPFDSVEEVFSSTADNAGAAQASLLGVFDSTLNWTNPNA